MFPRYLDIGSSKETINSYPFKIKVEAPAIGSCLRQQKGRKYSSFGRNYFETWLELSTIRNYVKCRINWKYVTINTSYILFADKNFQRVSQKRLGHQVLREFLIGVRRRAALLFLRRNADASEILAVWNADKIVIFLPHSGAQLRKAQLKRVCC